MVCFYDAGRAAPDRLLTVLIVRGRKDIWWHTDEVNKDLLSRFGRRIRELRSKRCMSQEALALEADLDRSYVGQVERGTRNISLENIEKLAEALGVSVSELTKGI